MKPSSAGKPHVGWVCATCHAGAGTVLATSAVVFGGFLWLTVRRLRRMDVP